MECIKCIRAGSTLSSWVGELVSSCKLQAANELGLQSSWAGISSWRRRRAASPIELGRDAAEKLHHALSSWRRKELHNYARYITRVI